MIPACHLLQVDESHSPRFAPVAPESNPVDARRQSSGGNGIFNFKSHLVHARLQLCPLLWAQILLPAAAEGLVKLYDTVEFVQSDLGQRQLSLKQVPIGIQRI